MELYTKDLVLRTVTEADLNEIARMMRYPQEITLQEAEKVLEAMQLRHSKNRPNAIFHLCLAVCRKEEPGKIIGWCGLDGRVSPNQIALFYIIAQEYRCKGYATQCACEVLRFAFEDMQCEFICGGCAKENIASFRVMEKAGMCHNEIYDDGGLGFYMDRKLYFNQNSKN